MPTILITGTSRGLGLELVRQYANDGWRVLACARAPETADELQEVAARSQERATVHALDVTDHAQIESLARQLEGVSIDVLLNSAGVMGRESFAEKGLGVQRFGATDYADWEYTLRVNVFGPMKLAEAFVDHVARSSQKKIVTLTSMLGSMGQNTIGGLYAYRSSKAAANSLMKSMAIDLQRHRRAQGHRFAHAGECRPLPAVGRSRTALVNPISSCGSSGRAGTSPPPAGSAAGTACTSTADSCSRSARRPAHTSARRSLAVDAGRGTKRLGLPHRLPVPRRTPPWP